MRHATKTYTITELDGGKRVGVQHFALALVPGGRTTLKNGSKVPVATGSFSTNNREVLVETGDLTRAAADLYAFTPLPTQPSQIATPLGPATSFWTSSRVFRDRKSVV
mgnify:CR=1 FL=1